ncbi:MAG: tail fiber domain-containing protein [Chitinophagaceae bacterium]
MFRFSPSGTTTLIGYQAGNADPTGAVENHFIGYQTGYNITSGFDNQFEGYQAGYKSTSGYSNQFMGFKAGYSNLTGTDNFFVGQLSGYSNVASNNHFVGSGAGFANTTGANNYFSGKSAGSANTTGSDNHFEGFQAGHSNTIGSNNYFSGNQAGKANISGSFNVFTGNNAGIMNISGNENVFTGDGAGYSNTSGSGTVNIGFNAGYNNAAGINNIFIGRNAGKNETGSSRLYIGSQISLFSPGLIYGELDNNFLRINGTQEIKSAGGTNGAPLLTLTSYLGEDSKIKFGTGNSTENWSINAQPFSGMTFWEGTRKLLTIYTDGNLVVKDHVIELSDRSLKTNINPLKNSLQNLLKLNGYSYHWIDPKNSKKEQIGLIAQEVEAQFPQLVETQKDGIKGVAYTHIIPAVIESIKEQQTMIDELKTANNKQAIIIENLLKRMEALEKR